MTNPSPRTADLRLRGSTGPVRARIHWPPPAPTVPKLLVFFPAWTVPDGGQAETSATDLLCRHLCARPGLMVLAAPCQNASDAISTVEWAAEHANELGADASAIALAGDGPSAELAENVARHAAGDGWPVIDGLVLIDPACSPRPDVAAAVVQHQHRTAGLAELAAAVRGALDRGPEPR